MNAYIAADSTGLEHAIEAAVRGGVTIIAEAKPIWCGMRSAHPYLQNVLTVGASNQKDHAFWGSLNSASDVSTCIDIFAPGVEIVTIGINKPALASLPAALNPTKDKVISSTTSVAAAAAHVAGAAALVLQAHPEANVRKSILRAATGATTPGAMQGELKGVGNKLLFVGPDLLAAPPAPAPSP